MKCTNSYLKLYTTIIVIGYSFKSLRLILIFNSLAISWNTTWQNQFTETITTTKWYRTCSGHRSVLSQSIKSKTSFHVWLMIQNQHVLTNISWLCYITQKCALFEVSTVASLRNVVSSTMNWLCNLCSRYGQFTNTTPALTCYSFFHMHYRCFLYNCFLRYTASLTNSL